MLSFLQTSKCIDHFFQRFYDGSGGNNHAVEHYTLTNYPLAVKLGTITKDGKGDVYSYSEDDMVEDPHLIQHLAHWGKYNILFFN